MSYSTTFVDQSTVITAGWLNDVDDLVYPVTAKTTLSIDDEVILRDSEATMAPKKVTLANLRQHIWNYWGASIAGGTVRSDIIDANKFAVTANSGGLASDSTRAVTWATIKSTLKTYFDTLYGTTEGTYTPTISVGDGASAYTLTSARYSRVGNTVYVTCIVAIDVTAAACSINISLPISTASNNAYGMGVSLTGLTTWGGQPSSTNVLFQATPSGASYIGHTLTFNYTVT